jgi:hypothetical protein
MSGERRGEATEERGEELVFLSTSLTDLEPFDGATELCSKL